MDSSIHEESMFCFPGSSTSGSNSAPAFTYPVNSALFSLDVPSVSPSTTLPAVSSAGELYSASPLSGLLNSASPLSGLPSLSLLSATDDLSLSCRVLYHTLCGTLQSDIMYPVFISDNSCLLHLALLHGVSTSVMSNIDDCRLLVCKHVLLGNCFDNSTRAEACKAVSQDFSCKRDVLCYIASVICCKDTHTIPTVNLLWFAFSLELTVDRGLCRESIIDLLRCHFAHSLKDCVVIPEHVTDPITVVRHIFHNFDNLTLLALKQLCIDHEIQFGSMTITRESLRHAIASHVFSGRCFDVVYSCPRTSSVGCLSMMQCRGFRSNPPSRDRYVYVLLEHISTSFSSGVLKRLLLFLDICFEPNATTQSCRSLMNSHLQNLRSRLSPSLLPAIPSIVPIDLSYPEHICVNDWPTPVPSSVKEELIKEFHQLTSSACLRRFTCASCGAYHPLPGQKLVKANSLDLSLLSVSRLKDQWSMSSSSTSPPFTCPLPQYPDVLLHPDGVLDLDSQQPSLTLCKDCHSAINRHKLPALALANHMFIGTAPIEFYDLTIVEEAMIARCRAKSYIIRLKEDGMPNTPILQRALKGNIIIYPQRPSAIAKILPPDLNDVASAICVIFIGSTRPTDEWLKTKAKPLTVRPAIVRSNLEWLKTHNILYHDVQIDYELLNSLPSSYSLPVHVEYLESSDIDDSLTSGYAPSIAEASSHDQCSSGNLSFDSVVIADVDGASSANDLRAAAIRHIKGKGGAYVEIPHDPLPVNEFMNPTLFPMIYPTLFPYGIGGFEDYRRTISVSMKRHVKHLLSLNDPRFQTHPTFSFTVFNILQRREMLLHISLKTKKSNFSNLAVKFSSVSAAAINKVAVRYGKGDTVTFDTPEERLVLDLMREVNLVTSRVPWSSSSLVTMRNQIRGQMMDQGLPSFYITINPADVYHPLVKFLAGHEIDIDNMLAGDVPKYWDQALLIANNSALGAQFFNLYMKAFIFALLGCDSDPSRSKLGIFGYVKGYYGCIEAQGRGSLHCHMLIWLHGSLNPNEIKKRVLDDPCSDFEQRIITFLDDTISNNVPSKPSTPIDVPSDTYHPCALRGTTMSSYDVDLMCTDEARQKDMHNLVQYCQVHRHTSTCYKYCKSGEPKICRFGLDPSNVTLLTSFDRVTGELIMRCLDGLVNNFNDTILRAIRCNMDIKFIGSGASAKAVLYYITNYITKSQLKTHVAYAALERAVVKLSQHNIDDTPIAIMSKKLLQKCAYSMISEQELSAQQVSTYLLGYEDHFTSHKYANLFWTSFEAYIERSRPSSACYVQTSEMNGKSSPETGNCVNSDNIEDNVEDGNEDNSDGTDDVQLDIGSNGVLIAKASQVDDYRFRSTALANVNVWEMIARFHKTKQKKRTQSEHSSDDDTSDEEDTATDMCNLQHTTRKCVKFPFIDGHPEKPTHCLRMCSPMQRKVPVPIGPPIPRRDRPQLWPKYCRLMLILFKPWRCVSDICSPEQSWSDAFSDFVAVCDHATKSVIDNMQILHECRDSRDDHFAKMSEFRRMQSQRAIIPVQPHNAREIEDDFLADDDEQHAILDHLHSIDNLHSRGHNIAQNDVNICIQHLEHSGRFDLSCPISPPPSHEHLAISDNLHEITDPNPSEEIVWKDAYDERKNSWKKRASVQSPADHCSDHTNEHGINSSIRSLSESFPSIHSTQIHGSLYKSSTLPQVNIDQFLAQFTPSLNTEQTRAFRIIASHSQLSKPEPLRMYIGGQGGTGKSLVIQALNKFFTEQGESRRFRLASFTGVAAKNISGMTLHSALCLSQNRTMKANSQSHRDLMTMWQGVDYLFIDEVSMIGCRFLLKISRALNNAKDNNTPFGGINIIFAGDFAQLGSVRDPRLFSFIPTDKASTVSAQEAIFGKLLWLSIKTVVIFSEVMRQAGSENAQFVDLLQRLRVGACTNSDFDLLNTRLLSSVCPDWNGPDWSDTPIIVSSNRAKDRLNEKAAEAFAKKTGQTLHWYYSSDTRSGEQLTDSNLQSYLDHLDSGKTNQRLGRIPLVIGMPVMITQNFDVESGIVNGCKGILKSIRYRVDDQGRRHAISCIVKSDNTSSSSPLPLLDDIEDIVVLEDKTSMSFTHEYTKKKCTIQRTQLPLAPAFAITSYKAQGQSVKTVLVDIESCSGTEAPYVMVSRVTSLSGLIILRPFQLKRIQSRQSEDMRKETTRLHYLSLDSILQNGTPSEVEAASHALASSNWAAPHPPDAGSTPEAQLASLQKHYRKVSDPKPPTPFTYRKRMLTDVIDERPAKRTKVTTTLEKVVMAPAKYTKRSL